MFKPGEIEGIPLGIEKQFSELEQRIMEDIVRRIKINGEITRAADWQIHRLYELGVSKREIKKYIKNSLKLNSKEVNHIYKDVIRKGYERDSSIYKYKGKPMMPYEENTGLQQLITAVSAQTNGEFKNITGTLGFAKRENGRLKFTELSEYYQKTLDGAMLDITSGVFDYNTVLKRVTKELTNSGLRTVDYASGKSIRVESAARMAVMTGVSQVTAQINESNAKELDTEYFEVTWHGGARPSHQEWQGKVYSKKELETVCGLGAADGLCGCNCYHDYYPFFPGISERSYTDEELAKLNKEENTPVEYNGKSYTKYEATQRQRALERTMRAERQQIHLLQQGGASEDDIILARGRYRATSSEYTRFSKAMKLPQQRERVTVDGLGNVGVGKFDLTNRSYHDIIFMKGKMSDVEARKWYLAHDKTIPDLIDKSLPIEQQAKQACDLRNQFRTQARDLMANQEKRKELDISDPNKSFEELVADKMQRKNLTREQAIEDVLNTATKTRKSVNKELGLEE